MMFAYCTILIVCLGTVTCNTLELLRGACPYSNFCTTPSLESFNKTDTHIPCCYDCFCDEHCSAFGDCCPDYKGNEKTSTNLVRIDCKTIHVATEQTEIKIQERYIDQFQPITDRYRVIDFCPDGYNKDPTMINKCNGRFTGLPQFADLVVVSDEAGRMFKNKHCAFCHGVRQFTSWQMKLVECLEDISTLQLTLSEAHNYLLNNCVMTSERPRGAHMTPRMLSCPGELTCRGTDQELARGCFSGPYMPFLDILGTVIVYKNVLCYKFCWGHQGNAICQNTVRPKLTAAPYQVLLNLRPEVQPSGSESIQCGEAKVMDKHTGVCRRMYCPPFDVVAYGHCVPMSTVITNLKIRVSILYTMANITDHPIFNNPETYNDTLRQYYLRRINKRHGYPNCSTAELSVTAKTEIMSGRLVYIVVNIVYEINQDCTIGYIAGRVRRSSRNDIYTETWLIQDVFLKMYGRVSFYDPSVNEFTNGHHSYKLLFSSFGFYRINPLENFFLCPYFKLSFEEYSHYMKGRGQVGMEENKPSPVSKYEDGFYPASENEIIVCVDTYQTGSGSDIADIARVYLICVIISLSTFII